jgi:hypothetical protein
VVLHCYPLAAFARFDALARCLRSLISRRCHPVGKRGNATVCIRYDAHAALLWCCIVSNEKYTLLCDICAQVRRAHHRLAAAAAAQ